MLAWSRGLERTVLTVQTANHAALAFYARQGYTADPTSPEQCPEDFVPEDRTYEAADGSLDFPYRILCKERPAALRQELARRDPREEQHVEQQGDAPESTAAKRRRREPIVG